MMRRVPTIYSHFLTPRASSSAAAAAAADLTVLRGAPYSTAASGASPRLKWLSSPSIAASPSIGSRSVSLGVAGALSFSLTLATAAQAKEPPAPDLVPKDVVLYQYQACPFCNKVRAFLDYYDIPYKVVEVNPISKKELKWSDYKKVPILVVDGEQLIESSDIVEQLSNRFHPDDCVVDEEEKKWRRWVDEHLVHLLAPNIYRSTSEALESFDYIAKTGNFSFTERLTAKYAGAAIMYVIAKKLKKKYNITDARASLYEAAETWTKALGDRDFLGGSKPNLADLAVFGVLRPIRYLSAGKDMVKNTEIGQWYGRMETAVGEPSRVQA